MATFITSTIEWNGKENLEYFLKPMFIGKQPWETEGVRVIPNVQSKMNLNYFGVAQKLLKAYVKGFNATAGTTYTQRTLEVVRMKAEAAEDGLDFFQTVFEQALRTDDWNNLDGTMLKNIIIELYRNAIKSDVFRQFWLNDTYKETLVSGVISGTADVDYNSFIGIWKLLINDSATSPTATQIKKVAVDNGAIAQVNTVTLTGTSGTANITIAGTAYLATFATDLDTTAANFVTSHAAALALRGLTITSGTATVVFTSSIAGQPIPTPTIANVSGDLAGTNAATTANTSATTLAAGESVDIFKALATTCDPVLKHTPKNGKVFIVTDTILENYLEYLETLGTEQANTLIIEGREFYKYRGILIIAPGWDSWLAADFPHTTGENPAYPHRAIYTTIDNLVLGIDSLNNFNETKMWFNEDEEENRFRTKLVMGANYVHNKLCAVAF